MHPEESTGTPLLNTSFSTWAHVCDRIEILTRARRRPSDHVNRKTKLQGENAIKDSCDQSVLSCDSVGSSVVRTSGGGPVGREKSDL